MENQKQVSLLAGSPESQIKAIKNSRLAELFKDPAVLARMAEAAVKLIVGDETLQKCTPESILGALYTAATLEFRLEKEFGECWLIPRKVKDSNVYNCSFQIGYQGWRALALKTGLVSGIIAREVYEEDAFDYEFGTSEWFKHKKADNVDLKKLPKYFYAHAKMKDGNQFFDVATLQQAEKYRRESESQWDWVGQPGSKVKKFSEEPKKIWKEHYPPMALRLPIKKVCSALPRVGPLADAIQADNSITYINRDGTPITITEVDVNKQSEPIVEERESEAIEAANVEMFLQVKDILASYSNFGEMFAYYEQFKTGELAKSKPFIRLFFEAAARLAEKVDELGRFYHNSTDWHKTEDLIKIITSKKAEIEKNGKSNPT